MHLIEHKEKAEATKENFKNWTVYFVYSLNFNKF